MKGTATRTPRGGTACIWALASVVMFASACAQAPQPRSKPEEVPIGIQGGAPLPPAGTPATPGWKRLGHDQPGSTSSTSSTPAASSPAVADDDDFVPHALAGYHLGVSKLEAGIHGEPTQNILKKDTYAVDPKEVFLGKKLSSVKATMEGGLIDSLSANVEGTDCADLVRKATDRWGEPTTPTTKVWSWVGRRQVRVMFQPAIYPSDACSVNVSVEHHLLSGHPIPAGGLDHRLPESVGIFKLGEVRRAPHPGVQLVPTKASGTDSAFDVQTKQAIEVFGRPVTHIKVTYRHERLEIIEARTAGSNVMDALRKELTEKYGAGESGGATWKDNVTMIFIGGSKDDAAVTLMDTTNF